MIASVAISGLTWRASRYGENYLATEIDRLEALLLQCEGAPTEMVEECLAKALDMAPPTRSSTFRTPFRHSVGPGNGRTQ
jgi:hypothetical protein